MERARKSFGQTGTVTPQEFNSEPGRKMVLDSDCQPEWQVPRPGPGAGRAGASPNLSPSRLTIQVMSLTSGSEPELAKPVT